MFDIFGWLNLDEAYNNLYSAIASLLSSSMIPSIVLFNTDWFRTTLGSAVGLGQALLTLVAILIGLKMILQPFRPVGGRPIGKMFTSIWTMAVFVMAFYPIVTLSLSFATWMRDIVASIMMGVEPSQVSTAVDQIVGTFTLGENVLKLIVMSALVVLGMIVFAVAMAIQGVTILVLFLYPIMIMLRPLGGLFDRLFHAANAVFVVALLGPAAMTAGILLPRLLQNWLLGSNHIAQAITALTASALAIWLPFAIGGIAYQRSTTLIGPLESRAYGAVNIDRLPPMDAHGRGGSGALKAFGVHLATGALGLATQSDSKDDFFKNLKHVAADAVGTGLTMAGHPLAGAAVSTVDTISRNREGKKKEQARETANEATPRSTSVPQPPQGAASPIPVAPPALPDPDTGPDALAEHYRAAYGQPTQPSTDP